MHFPFSSREPGLRPPGHLRAEDLLEAGQTLGELELRRRHGQVGGVQQRQHAAPPVLHQRGGTLRAHGGIGLCEV